MARPKTFCVIGTSFRTASMDTRASYSIRTEETTDLLHAIKAHTPGLEALVLSTCNRIEFYLASENPFEAPAIFRQVLNNARPSAPVPQEHAWGYHFAGAEAAEHLFKVASGLDSAILGDVQILGQLKRAFADAVRAGTAGHYMHRTVGTALRCGKRARRETSIASGAPGIGSAMVSLLARHLAFLNAPPRVLVLGSGKVACDAGRLIVRRLTGDPCFLGRSLDRASEAARKCGGTAAHWSELPRLLAQTDAVVAATSAPHAVLTREMLDAACRERGQRPLLVLDAGMPRNVEPGSRATVLDLEHIRRHQDGSLALRQAAVPSAERIVEEESRRWRQWSASLRFEPLIKHLYEHADRQSTQHARAIAFWMRCQPDQAERMLQKNHRRDLHAQVRKLREHAQATFISKDLLAQFAPGYH